MESEREYDRFWDWLNEMIEEILADLDGRIALGGKELRTRAVQNQAGVRPQIRTNERNETAIVPKSLPGLHEIKDLRRPEDEDEYWSLSPAAWSLISHARQEMLSHVGRINETSEGEQAPNGDCDNCAKTGAECMVYRNLGNHPCSRCRFRSLRCSHQAVAHSKTRKRKKTRFGVSSPHKIVKTIQ